MKTKPQRGQPAYALCRCGNWEIEHDTVTGRAPVLLIPNTEHRYEFYRFAFTKVSGEPYPSAAVQAWIDAREK